MLVLVMPDMDMLDILMLDLDMLDMPDILMLLDMLLTAHLPAPTLLVLLPLRSLRLLEDMLVLDVMLPTLPELSMLPNVKLRLKLTLLCFMELMDMLVLGMPDMDMLDILMLDLVMLDMPDILMLLDMLLTAHLPAPTSLVLPLLLSPLLLEDMPVLDVMLPTLPELFMLPKLLNFKIVDLGICPYLNKFPLSIK